MSAYPREGPNPLRPYYVPPSIGIPQDQPGSTNAGTRGLGLKNGSAASYASSARDMFQDMDYSEYLPDSSPSTIESMQGLIKQGYFEYMGIFMSHPFNAAKTILQVKSQRDVDDEAPASKLSRSRTPSYRESIYEDYPSDDSDQDELTYFTSSAPSAHSYSPVRSRSGRHTERMASLSPTPSRKSPNPDHQLLLKQSHSILEVISQEWTKEGALGVWKGTNITWIYNILLKMLENWSRGLISGMLNVPDPGMAAGFSADVLNTPYPWSSLGVAVGAAVTAGLILAPLDLIRTRLILTPRSYSNRDLTTQIRTLPSYFCTPKLFVPTILCSLVTPSITHSAPLFIRSNLGIDPVRNPSPYSLAISVSQIAELFLHLPFETVLRRAQMSVLASPPYLKAEKSMETMVDVGPYKGVLGTMWSIVREEGTSEVSAGSSKAKKGKKVARKGQGVEGLWRGWSVGMFGLLGIWGLKAMGSGNVGGEF